MDCPHLIKSVLPTSILPHVVVANQALHGNAKVRGPAVEAIQASHLLLPGQVKLHVAMKVEDADDFHKE